jgi:hypothetical protein
LALRLKGNIVSLGKDALRRRVVQMQHARLQRPLTEWRRYNRQAVGPRRHYGQNGGCRRRTGDVFRNYTRLITDGHFRLDDFLEFELLPVMIVPIDPNVTPTQWQWLSAAVALAIAGASTAGFLRARGTTLAAPAVWCIVSALAIAGVEALLAYGGECRGPLSASLWRYSVAVSTICPLMAVLGAKRPQDRGWQWVVISLWIVLLVPAGQALAATSGPRLELFGIWRAMIGGLIVMGLLNYLPTLYALSAMLMAIGQAGLVSPYLFDVEVGEPWRVGSLLLMLFAIGLLHFVQRRDKAYPRSSSSKDERIAAFNERWLAFRDGWGAFWSLRVLQRINQTAELSHWPVQLQWSEGFQSADDCEIDETTAVHIQQTLDSLLRRFERQ